MSQIDQLADVVMVCWASTPHIIAGKLDDLAVSDDGMAWHDHSTAGGDIVCTGPFTLAVDPAR